MGSEMCIRDRYSSTLLYDKISIIYLPSLSVLLVLLLHACCWYCFAAAAMPGCLASVPYFSLLRRCVTTSDLLLAADTAIYVLYVRTHVSAGIYIKRYKLV